MHSQAVVAITPEDQLPDILTRIHGAGLGHNARVLRPRRGPLLEQLRRAGVPVRQAPRRLDDAACVLLITAAARSPQAANLTLQHGASATWTVSTSGTWALVDDHIVDRANQATTAEAIPAAHPDDAADAPSSI